jgi:hypothetical protein
MVDSNQHRGRSRRPDAEDQRWSSISRILGGRTIERLSDAVCDLHCARGDEERGFLDLALKPRSTVSFGLLSKPVASVSRFGH